MAREWVEWHKGYEGDQPHAKRLRVVQQLIRESLTNSPPGSIRIISMCAGDGRDLMGALRFHPRAADLRARLVELDPELVRAGRERAAHDGLPGVEFVLGDAATTNAYAGAVPADIVLVCGVFGNISDSDVRDTINHLPELCAANATVIWTRGRFEPDLTPRVRAWFRDAGFDELAFVAIPDTTVSVGSHRLAGAPRPIRADERLFTFLPREARPSTRSESRGETTTPAAGP
ncbi:MAG: class I SAM-dependent methyltransferase family protein [Thermoplasmata archaeon]